MRQAFFIIPVIIFLNGCTCGTGRATLKQTELPEAQSKITHKTDTIHLGMTKDQVHEAWGKATLAGESLWIYSNDRAKPYVKNAIEYDVYFEDNKIVKIVEKALDESQFGCAPLDL